MTLYHQPELINPEQLPPRLRWQKLFALLPPWPGQTSARRGRNPVSRSALLNACIYQRLTGRRFLTDLCTHLEESPPVLAAVGFKYSTVCGDAEYDSEHILRYIRDTLQAKPYFVNPYFAKFGLT